MSVTTATTTTMRINSAVAHRVSAATRAAAASLSAYRHNNAFKHYKPLLVSTANLSSLVQNQASVQSHLLARDKSCFQNQTRWLASKSLGHCAPSTLASTDPTSRVHHANATVFEDCEHLPALPVPNLNETLERLRETIWPVAMNAAEFASALNLIDKFSGSAGQKLDLLLRNKAAVTKNWLTHDWWLDETYLKSRTPLVINSNPGMIYPVMPFDVNNQRVFVNTTAQLISGIIDFKLALLHGYNPDATSTVNEHRLEPNVCYDQYRRLFGSTRIPGTNMDSIKTCDADKYLSIVLSFRNKLYEIKLHDIDNEQARIETLTSVLNKLISTSTSDGDDVSRSGLGLLTTSDRNTWAKAFTLLDVDSMNTIQEAQFVVCIDTLSSQTSDGINNANNPNSNTSTLLSAPIGSDHHLQALARHVLHSDESNIGNRWFDKTLQLIVVADNNVERLLGAGINYEHSLAEGLTVTKLIEYSYDKTVQKNRSEASRHNLYTPQQIQSYESSLKQLRMTNEHNVDKISQYISDAKQNYISHIGQFDLSYFKYKNYGQNAIKSWRCSPDSWFQVALQLAYYNQHKRLGPCYESAAMRRFAYGRTETIRSLTRNVAEFCINQNPDTMKAAIQSHKSYTNAALSGNAIDRVLLGYRLTFNELKNHSWLWGLPKLDETKCDITTYHNSDVLGREMMRELSKRINGSLSATEKQQHQQQFAIEDLFTEKELSIIGAFFNNALIERSRKFALSTSQVASVHPNICMSYGPLLADGYGVCYNLTGQQIVAAITANSSNLSFSCDVHELNQSLGESLNKMRAIVENKQLD